MTALPNGAYHLYTSETLPPLVVEVQYDWIWECGDSQHRPLSNYANARFVRLQEVREVGEVEAANEAPRL